MAGRDNSGETPRAPETPPTPVGSLLAEMASVLGTADSREVRWRFEQCAARHLGVPFVRLRDRAEDDPASQAENGSRVVALPVIGGPAALELPCSASALQQDGNGVLQAALCLAGLVCDIERAAGYKSLTGSELKRRDGNLLLGSGPAMQTLRQQIDRIARRDFSVLIQGESGVGKELVARQIHLWSRRARGPFVAVNCAALVESLLEAELFGIEDRTATGVRGRRGKFEQADGGTLFLDEVADLSLQAQAKLLRALQEFTVERVGGQGSRRVDIRLIAATNRSLPELTTQRQFRDDLYYRLNSLELHVPPLRAHREDIGELIQGCLRKHQGVGPRSIAPAALEALLTYEWPGNVRELERVLERAITLADGENIGLDDLPKSLSDRYRIVQPLGEGSDSMRAWGSRYARLVLERCEGNKRQACRVLDISYHTLQAYLRYRPRERAVESGPVEVKGTGNGEPPR